MESVFLYALSLYGYRLLFILQFEFNLVATRDETHKLKDKLKLDFTFSLDITFFFHCDNYAVEIEYRGRPSLAYWLVTTKICVCDHLKTIPLLGHTRSPILVHPAKQSTCRPVLNVAKPIWKH